MFSDQKIQFNPEIAMKNLKASVLNFSMFPLFNFSQQKFEETYSGLEGIDITVSSGDAIFKKSKDANVHLTLTHNMGNYHPQIQQRGNKLNIQDDRSEKVRWNDGPVLWTFEVPDDMVIGFNTGSGDVLFAEISVKAKINSGSGVLAFDDIKGEIRGITGSGDIDFQNSSGHFNMNTGSGSIQGNGLSGYMTMTTGSGSIEIQDLVVTDACSFNAGAGKVKVSLSGPLSNDLYVNSGSKDAILNLNGNKIEGAITMKADTKKGRIIAPFDFEKEEEIDNGSTNKVVLKTTQIGDKDIKINVGTGNGTAKIKA